MLNIINKIKEKKNPQEKGKIKWPPALSVA